MFSSLVRSVPRPDRAARSDLAVAAYCVTFGVSPEESRDTERDRTDDR